MIFNFVFLFIDLFFLFFDIEFLEKGWKRNLAVLFCILSIIAVSTAIGISIGEYKNTTVLNSQEI